ncbi:hypothetical protein, partial [Aliivibrio fischeri]|uniref:hypothetical protein n=1 Tax=Aliivibrio fischeri TaxID=668 RepID=UPI001969C898
SPVRSANTTKALSKDDAFFVSVENENASEIQINSGFQKIGMVISCLDFLLESLAACHAEGRAALKVDRKSRPLCQHNEGIVERRCLFCICRI